jgi:putative redox protein
VWASRYALDPEPHQVGAPDPELAEGHVRVSETSAQGFAQEIRAGRHLLHADEPLGVGTDTGPSPYDLLLAGLGACTSMTIRMYATRKKWPLEHVSVELSHSRTHANDCAACDESTEHLQLIDRTITLTGDLDAAQRDALLAIADKCPVHRTLHAGVLVTTTMA